MDTNSIQQPKQWIVTHGAIRKVFYTDYHAEQYARALELNGTEYKLERTCAKRY